MSTGKYREMCKGTAAQLESRDCSVKALAITTGVTYEMAHTALMRAGRKHGRGVHDDVLTAAAAELGFDLIPRSVEGETMRSIAKWRLKYPHIVRTRNHFAPLIGGIIHDWSQGRRHRPLRVFKVVKRQTD